MGKADRMVYLALAAPLAGLAGRPEWLNAYLALDTDPLSVMRDE